MKHAIPSKHPTAVSTLTAFLLSLLVFGSVLLIPAFWGSETEPNPMEADGLPAHVWRIGLFFREDANRLSGMVLLTVDMQMQKLSAVAYPPNTDLGGKTLQTYATNDGTAAAFVRLCEEIGTVGDKALTVSVSDLAAFIVHLKERLPLTLPEPMEPLPAGESTLTPMQVADVLRYREWSDGVTVQAQLHAQVVAALFNRYLLPDRNLESDFKKLSQLCEEPLSISQYATSREILEALSHRNEGQLCSAAIADGEMVVGQTDTYYRLNKTIP